MKLLPDYEGIANDMGDFFVPDDARTEIVIRRGKILSHSRGVVDCIIAAFTPNDNFNLLVYTLGDDKIWDIETSIINSNVVKTELVYLIKEYRIRHGETFKG